MFPRIKSEGRLVGEPVSIPDHVGDRLSPEHALMATRRGFDPLSPRRQRGRLTRCVTGRELVRAVRLERTLYALSTHSLCRLGYARVVDTPGNDPGPDRLRAGRSAR